MSKPLGVEEQTRGNCCEWKEREREKEKWAREREGNIKGRSERRAEEK